MMLTHVCIYSLTLYVTPQIYYHMTVLNLFVQVLWRSATVYMHRSDVPSLTAIIFTAVYFMILS